MVQLLDVSEMIDAGLLQPDTRVMLEGTDYWRTYFEQENIVFPSVEASRHSENYKNSHTSYVFYFQNGEVSGPLLLTNLLGMIVRQELPGDVQICLSGTEEWVRVTTL